MLWRLGLRIWGFGFGICFGFRISGFGFFVQAKLKARAPGCPIKKLSRAVPSGLGIDRFFQRNSTH